MLLLARVFRCIPVAGPFLIAALAHSATTQAAVTELERDAFLAALAGRPAFVEDFEGYAVGATAGPLTLGNGVVFDNLAPFVTTGFGGTSQLLIGNAVPLTSARVFTGFAADATLVSFEVFFDQDDDFDVTVLTTSGDSLFIAARRGRDFENFFGIQVLGDSIASIAFSGLGGSPGPGSDGSGITNYGFDNILVDVRAQPPVPVPVPVPLPPALALAALLWFARRRG